MEVDVQVQGVPEALHEGDGPALTAGHAPLPPSATAQRREDGPQKEIQHGARELGVVGEPVAEREREREHPLADRDLREHALHQMGGRVAHAPAPQVGQKPRPLHEKATTRSRPQSSQRTRTRTRTKPWARMPQRRKPRSSAASAARGAALGTSAQTPVALAGCLPTGRRRKGGGP
jgi:hypothetical protein